MRVRGFTLIELLIGLAIFGFLLMLAGPMYGNLMGNSQIRNAGDAILNGVQHAQSTAIRGNALTRLVVNPTTGTGGWQVIETIEGVDNTVQVYSLADGSPNASVTPTPPDATRITFDGFGRIVPNVDASPTLTCLKVTNPNVSTPRRLNVAISSSGLSVGTKLCDPAAAATEPQACPAGCA
jgi:prepilin-type N-terminal cleavage/methylation domain-containing protein